MTKSKLFFIVLAILLLTKSSFSDQDKAYLWRFKSDNSYNFNVFLWGSIGATLSLGGFAYYRSHDTFSTFYREYYDDEGNLHKEDFHIDKRKKGRPITLPLTMVGFLFNSAAISMVESSYIEGETEYETFYRIEEAEKQLRIYTVALGACLIALSPLAIEKRITHKEGMHKVEFAHGGELSWELNRDEIYRDPRYSYALTAIGGVYLGYGLGSYLSSSIKFTNEKVKVEIKLNNELLLYPRVCLNIRW